MKCEMDSSPLSSKVDDTPHTKKSKSKIFLYRIGFLATTKPIKTSAYICLTTYTRTKSNTPYINYSVMAYKIRSRHPGHISSDGKWEMTIDQFKKWLNTFDVDGDGRISRYELQKAVLAVQGQLTTWKAKRVVKSADTNHNGFIDQNEVKNLISFAEKELNFRIIASL